MNYKSYNDLSTDIRGNLNKLQNEHFDLIVGIPRSGMIPAYMLGLYLNCNVTDIDGLIENRKLSKGITRSSKVKETLPWDANKILIVDDSISSGKSLKKTLDRIPDSLISKVTTLAIYSDQVKRDDINLWLTYLPQPRIFEWNIFHHSFISNACLDIDGVLCKDPLPQDNDDGEKYRAFILNAEPLFLPTTKVYALVTSRLGKYRNETEIWLKKHGVEYEHLIMLEGVTAEERREQKLHGIHKGNFYKKSSSNLLIESEPHQARQIMVISNKPVYCTGDNKMYLPFYQQVIPTQSINKILFKIKSMIPQFIKTYLKKLRKTYV